MTSFMGPMAPPPAAPPQPQKLDIQSDPNQRQKFKQFMKQRMSMGQMQPPMMPQQPMMQPAMMQPPMGMPMGQDIDIFNPVNFHDGGIVPSLNNLQQQAAQFAEQIQGTVMGGGGGGMGGGMGAGSAGGGFSTGAPSVSPPPVTGAATDPVSSTAPLSTAAPDTSATAVSTPAPSTPANTTLGGSLPISNNDPADYANPTIDQGFYESDIFKNLDMSGYKTMDMRLPSEATGGFSGSSTDIGKLQDAYQQYLQGGQQGGMQQAVVNPQVDPNPVNSIPSPLVAYPPGYFDPAFGVYDPTIRDDILTGGVDGGPREFTDRTDFDNFLQDKYTPYYDERKREREARENRMSTFNDAMRALPDTGKGPPEPIPFPIFDPITGPPRLVPFQGQFGNSNFSPAVSPYANQLPNNIQRELSSDSPFFNVPEVGTGQQLPSDPSALGGGASNLIADNPYLSDIGGIGGIGGLLMRNEGGAVPPRRTDIRGQDHMLSYITPDEADILKALGGSGEAGPMGIPSFPEPGMGGDQDSRSGSGNEAGVGGGMGEGQGGDGAGGGDPSGGDDRGEDRGMSPGRSQAQFGTPEFAGKTPEQAQNEINRGGGGTPKSVITRVPNETTQLLNLLTSDVSPGKLRDDQLGGMPSQYTEIPDMAMGRPNPNVNMLDDFGAPTTGTGVAPTVNTGPRDTRGPDAGMGTNLLGLDDLLTAPSVPTGTTTTTPTGPTTSAPLGMEDEYDDLTREQEIARNIGYTDAGLPRGLNFIDTPQGRMTTNLAGTTAAQRADMPGYMNTRADDQQGRAFGGDTRGLIGPAVDFVLGNPAQSVYGYEIPDYDPKNPDASSGQITGFTGPSNMPGVIGSGLNFLQDLFMDPPENTKDLLNRGVYTGFGPGSQIGMDDIGDGPDQQVKAPTDPCPDGFVMKDGACTPIETEDTPPNQIGNIVPPSPPPVSTTPVMPPSVVVPSPRQPITSTLQGPVGYGVPTAGQAAPSVASNAALYQQMLNQQALNPPQYLPIKFQQGGAVSSNLDMAADNFLKALMPAA